MNDRVTNRPILKLRTERDASYLFNLNKIY